MDYCSNCGKIKKHQDEQKVLDFIRKELGGRITDNYSEEYQKEKWRGVVKANIDIGKFITNKSGYTGKMSVFPDRLKVEITYNYRNKE